MELLQTRVEAQQYPTNYLLHTTQVEARTLSASLHGSEVEARHALQAQEAMQAHIDALEARLPEMEARRGEAREAQSAAEARRDELNMQTHVMDAERLRALGEADQVYSAVSTCSQSAQ